MVYIGDGAVERGLWACALGAEESIHVEIWLRDLKGRYVGFQDPQLMLSGR